MTSRKNFWRWQEPGDFQQQGFFFIREGKEPVNAILPEIRHKVLRCKAGKDKRTGMGIARLDMENAFPDMRGCEAGVREDHQIKLFAHPVTTGRD